MRRHGWFAGALGLLCLAAGICLSDAPAAAADHPTATLGRAGATAPRIAATPTPQPAAAPTVSPTASTGPAVAPSELPGVVLTPGDDSDLDSPEPTTGDGGSSGGSNGSGISGMVRRAINSFFRGIVTKAVNPTIEALGRTVMSTPDVAGQPRVRQMWRLSLQVVNITFVLLVFCAGLLMLTHDTMQSRYEFKEDAPRLLFAWVAANASLSIAAMAVDVANATSRTFTNAGVDRDSAARALLQMVVDRLLPFTATNAFMTLVMLVMAVMMLLVLLTCIIRTTTVMLLVMVGPMCLAFYALPQTAGVARMWWRALAGALGVQIAQAFVFTFALQVFFDGHGVSSVGLTSSPGGGLMDMLVLLSLFWVLLKIPSWIGRSMLAPSGGNGSRILKMALATQVLGGVRTSVLHHHRSGPARLPRAAASGGQQ